MPDPSPHDPHAEYSRRLQVRQAEANQATKQERRLADLRLVTGLIGLGLLLAVFLRWVAPGWLALPAVLFGALALRHDAAIRRRERAERAVRFYEEGLARLEGRWPGRGASGERFLDAQHLYAADLDLFGRGSLFERLCTARTRAGEDTLAGWLLRPSPVAETRERQAAVADLRPRLDLREDLALLGADVRSEVHAEQIVAWGAAPVTLRAPGGRILAGVLGGLTAAAGIAGVLGAGWLPFAGMLVFEYGLLGRAVGEAMAVNRQAERWGRELALLGRLLERLEREAYASPRLEALRRSLDAGGLSPSRQLAELERLIGYLEAQRNGLFAVLGFALLWPLQCAYALERWRTRSGAHLGEWVAVTGEIEALAALAGYAWENPEDPFPDLQEGEPRYRAEGIAHPLLPGDAVRNDLVLDSGSRLLVVSGSNMSGKSTLLRSVGTNAVLAMAGAPVRARSLRLTPFVLGASLRTQDSLQGGVSRFYAEITRLREIVDRAGGEYPLLFLLDEILHGTNSHDRRIGAEAVLRALVAPGAFGLVTTHDLALAGIVDDPALAARNVHFEDHLEDGKMAFDYRLRPGVVRKSNALELMRAVGLEV